MPRSDYRQFRMCARHLSNVRVSFTADGHPSCIFSLDCLFQIRLPKLGGIFHDVLVVQAALPGLVRCPKQEPGICYLGTVMSSSARRSKCADVAVDDCRHFIAGENHAASAPTALCTKLYP